MLRRPQIDLFDNRIWMENLTSVHKGIFHMIDDDSCQNIGSLYTKVTRCMENRDIPIRVSGYVFYDPINESHWGFTIPISGILGDMRCSGCYQGQPEFVDIFSISGYYERFRIGCLMKEQGSKLVFNIMTGLRMRMSSFLFVRTGSPSRCVFPEEEYGVHKIFLVQRPESLPVRLDHGILGSRVTDHAKKFASMFEFYCQSLAVLVAGV
jgi:hypothetical protein